MIRQTLVEKTQAWITDLIQRKEYDQNNYLPSEGELGEMFGVSRATVREAVRSMEMRGLLRRRHGKGVQVIDDQAQVVRRFLTDMMSMRNSDMLELIEMRAIIEVEAARLAAKRAKKGELTRLEKCLEAMETAARMDDRYYDSDLEFHVEVVRAAKNNLLYTFVDAYTPLMRANVVEASQFDYCIEQRFHFHRNVFDAMVAGDADGAADAMRVHMSNNRENYLTSQKRKKQSARKESSQ